MKKLHPTQLRDTIEKFRMGHTLNDTELQNLLSHYEELEQNLAVEGKEFGLARTEALRRYNTLDGFRQAREEL
jgi:hypothetical protein